MRRRLRCLLVLLFFFLLPTFFFSFGGLLSIYFGLLWRLDPQQLLSVPFVTKLISMAALEKKRVDLPFKLSHNERLLLVLGLEDLVVRIRHLCYNALEHGLAHRVEVRCLVLVVVLAAPPAWRIIRVCLA